MNKHGTFILLEIETLYINSKERSVSQPSIRLSFSFKRNRICLYLSFHLIRYIVEAMYYLLHVRSYPPFPKFMMWMYIKIRPNLMVKPIIMANKYRITNEYT